MRPHFRVLALKGSFSFPQNSLVASTFSRCWQEPQDRFPSVFWLLFWGDPSFPLVFASSPGVVGYARGPTHLVLSLLNGCFCTCVVETVPIRWPSCCCCNVSDFFVASFSLGMPVPMGWTLGQASSGLWSYCDNSPSTGQTSPHIRSCNSRSSIFWAPPSPCIALRHGSVPDLL